MMSRKNNSIVSVRVEHFEVISVTNPSGPSTDAGRMRGDWSPPLTDLLAE